MPANKAHFTGRSQDPNTAHIDWQVVYTVIGEDEPHVDVTHTIQFTVTHGGNSKTYETNITNHLHDADFHDDLFPDTTKSPTGSFNVTQGNSGSDAAAALVAGWTAANPLGTDPRASQSGDSVTFSVPNGTITGQNYRVNFGSWIPVGPSLSTVVSGLSVDNV